MDGDRSSRIRPGDVGADGFDCPGAAFDESLLDAVFWRLGQGNVVPDYGTNYSGDKGPGFQNWRTRGAIPQSVLCAFPGWSAVGKQRSRAGWLARMVWQFSMRL